MSVSAYFYDSHYSTLQSQMNGNGTEFVLRRKNALSETFSPRLSLNLLNLTLTAIFFHKEKLRNEFKNLLLFLCVPKPKLRHSEMEP